MHPSELRVLALAGLVLVSCRIEQREDARRSAAAVIAEQSATAQPRQPGLRFDPAEVRPGTRLGDLTLDSIAFTTASDSILIGVARFSGEARVSGWTMRYPDPDSRAVCFEADSASAAALPRWAGDERRSWFCLENQAAAERALGPPSDSVPATIVIDRFTIRRGLSDEVNGARLVRLLEGGIGASGDGGANEGEAAGR